MTAESAQDCSIYHCVVCGPVMRFIREDHDTDLVLHHDIEHPDSVFLIDDEGNPQ